MGLILRTMGRDYCIDICIALFLIYEHPRLCLVAYWHLYLQGAAKRRLTEPTI
uniref:Uncharacterized protein n=1 Tax=Setaria italica TaxID=4555 RepID=K3YXN0_SETIT